eukprot:scaffold22245_cov63-Phaeocystis_antarctica.AAC.4
MLALQGVCATTTDATNTQQLLLLACLIVRQRHTSNARLTTSLRLNVFRFYPHIFATCCRRVGVASFPWLQQRLRTVLKGAKFLRSHRRGLKEGGGLAGDGGGYSFGQGGEPAVKMIPASPVIVPLAARHGRWLWATAEPYLEGSHGHRSPTQPASVSGGQEPCHTRPGAVPYEARGRASGPWPPDTDACSPELCRALREN